MKKNQIDKDIVTILVATLVTAIVWVGIEVYQAYYRKEAPIIEDKYLQEFDPKLDIVVLDQLEKRQP